MKITFNRTYLLVIVPALFLLISIAVAGVYFQVSIPVLTRDVTATAEIHPFTGILSNLGILLWCSAAAVLFFTAMNIRNEKHRNNYYFLLSSAFLSTFLLLDDFFLFHEHLSPRYLGLSEKMVYTIIGICAAVYLIVFMRIILRTHFFILLLSLGFLGTSVVTDAILEPWLWQIGQWEYLLEDGAKWLGIVSWCSYYILTSHQLLTRTSDEPNH